MIHIQITDAYLDSKPAIKALGKAFILSVGDSKYPVLSVSRNTSTIEDAVRNGSPTQINLRPGEAFLIQNEVFEMLVKSSSGGGDTNLIDRLLHFADLNVVDVLQDGLGTPLTSKQILNYEAP